MDKSFAVYALYEELRGTKNLFAKQIKNCYEHRLLIWRAHAFRIKLNTFIAQYSNTG